MLYAFGSNGAGQLGVGHTHDLATPEPISASNSRPKDWNILQLAAGGNHTVILCDDGKVRATGNNEDGRCGIKGIQHLNRFTEVDLPINESGQHVTVKQVVATWSTTLILSNAACVFVFGT